MKIDFTKLNKGVTPDRIIEPRKIFTTLSRAAKFRRPSDEQGEVLDKWFASKDQSDITIKMNTGSGKTLVGLLILQSSLNEGIFPAVYVTPDAYLTQQVIKEAGDLGILTTIDENSNDFLTGKAILVINIHKLINGKSIFGVGSQGIKVKIGSVIIDDAHACLVKAQDQFNIKIQSSHPLYAKLFTLFQSSLKEQSHVGMLEVESQDPQRVMMVPFWSWKDKESEVTRLLHDFRNDDDIKFKWPLLSDVLSICQCAFGGGKIEISPRYLPIDIIPSFLRAKRRIYMTATLADDGILVTHFKAKSSDISNPIRPKGVGDMGDRMILVPQEINPDITDEEVKKLAKDISKDKNVVVLVPSHSRAGFWADISDQVLDATNIGEGVDKMKKGHVGLSVFVNKYDGIDLPGKACELLIIDGLPEVYGLIERVDASTLDGTELDLLRNIERIEQGMGRGVRSSEDHCAILLLGSRLTQRVHKTSAREKFTPATLAQIDLGRELTKQFINKPVDELRPILDYCFNEDPEWQQASRTAIVSAPERHSGFIDPYVQDLRDAFDFARDKKWQLACDKVQGVINSTEDPIIKGYFMQQLAEYMYHINPVESQKILGSARVFNSQILKPVEGVIYTKLKPALKEQSLNVIEYLDNFDDVNDLVLSTNALLEDLNWDQERTKNFEKAIQELGFLIGFGSQRPEAEFGVGPDNLWATGDLSYFVIECKSGSISDFISKSECNQLLGSVSWFKSKYDDTCGYTPILIHPSNQFDKYSSPTADFRIINKDCLEKLRENLRTYITAIASNNASKNAKFIAEQLEYFKFTTKEFLNTYTTKFFHKK